MWGVILSLGLWMLDWQGMLPEMALMMGLCHIM